MIAGLSEIHGVAADATPEARRAAFDRVVESFEAVFVSQLVRGFRETFCKEFWGGAGYGKDIYASWFDQALAEAITKGGGIGVKSQLERWVFPTEKDTSPDPADNREAPRPGIQGRF